MAETAPGGAGAGFGFTNPSQTRTTNPTRVGGPAWDLGTDGIDKATKSLGLLENMLGKVKAKIVELTSVQPKLDKMMASLGSVGGAGGGGGGGGSKASGPNIPWSGGSGGGSSAGTVAIPWSGGGGSNPFGTGSVGGAGGGFGGGGGGGAGGGFFDFSTPSGVGGVIESVFSMMLKPVQLARTRYEENRSATLGMARYLGGVSSRSGSTIEELIGTLANRTPMQGDLGSILGALRQASFMGFTPSGGNQAMSGGFFEAARQFQMLNPDMPANQIVANLGGFMGNRTSVQRSVLFTGGAFSMQGGGGRTKSLQEWAAGILRFFEGQRPGSDRGKKFSRQELETQQFPGSNMNAWFELNGVPDYMVDAFWQYAISQAGSTSDSFEKIIRATRGSDMAFERLRVQSAGARRDFAFTSQGGNYGNYIRREGADRNFQHGLARTFDTYLPRITGALGLNDVMGGLPSPIADLMYNFVMGLPTIAGQLGSAIPMMGDTPQFIGDVPIGDANPGPYGNRGLGGLTPGMQDKVGAMMRANPRLRITSGYRDGGTQDRLHRRGVGKVAPNGRSQHTRGLAADLGPSSEFGWIVANAHRFGLEHGAMHGEPWHVGAPGTVPKMRRPGVGDTPSSAPIGDLWDIIAGASGNPIIGAAGNILGAAGIGVDDAVGGIGGVLGNIPGLDGLAALGKLAGSAIRGAQSVGGLVMDAPGMIFDFLKSMMNGGKGLDKIMEGFAGRIESSEIGNWLGMLTGKNDGNWAPSGGGGMGGIGGMLGAGGGGSPVNLQGLRSRYNLPSVGAAHVSEAQKLGIAVTLKAAADAGFQGEDLLMIAAIAGKESGWNPRALNIGPKDQSYGLYQINMKGSLGPARRQQYGLSSNEQLYDPNVSSRIARSIYESDRSLRAWGIAQSSANREATAKYLEPVYHAARQMGYIGDPEATYAGGAYSGGSPAITYSPSVRNTTAPTIVKVNAPISVQAQMSNQGDARQLARVLADHLGAEISERVGSR